MGLRPALEQSRERRNRNVRAGSRTRDRSRYDSDCLSTRPPRHVPGSLHHLRISPVLVESPLGLLANVLSPDSLESPETSGCLNISDHSDGNEGWGLDDGHSLHDLLLVHLGAGSVHLPDDVSHTSLVAEKGGHVHRLGGVILGEGLAFSHVSL